MNGNKTFAITMAAIVIGGIGLIVWGGANKNAPVDIADPDIDVTELTAIAPDDHTKGPENAPVVLIEYLDMECEACRAYYPLVKQLEQEYPDDLLVVKRYFPLPGHRNGMTAALAVEAAAQQGKYNEMHDLLFEQQPNWGEKAVANPSLFVAYAEQIGLDMEQYQTDVASDETRARVERDVESGLALGARGTPTFILNGKRIDNPQGYEAFIALIEAELPAEDISEQVEESTVSVQE